MTAYPARQGVPAAGHVAGGGWHPGPISTCSRCDPWPLGLWEAPSGRLHLHQRCTGAAPPARMRRARVTRAEFGEAKLCRCLFAKAAQLGVTVKASQR